MASSNNIAIAEDQGWTKSQLMGGVEESAAPKKKKEPKGKGVAEDPLLWGRPGHLTADEADTYFKLQQIVNERGGDFRSTVFCFGETEGEVWALTRWLRARKFVLDDVIAMIEEATRVRHDAKDHDFYPNPADALGCEAALYYAMYPQLYYGNSKHGVPLYFSKAGVLNVDGVEQITTLDGIIKFHWYIMMHDYANRLRAQKAKDPSFKRFECVCVLDLDKLTTSQLSRKSLAIIKEQAAIDSVCFPETMAKMLIINAPTFFAATWRIIKGWLDPRTAAKIEVISSRSACEKRLAELADLDQLPSDYGGTGPSTEEILAKSSEGTEDKFETTMMYVRGHGSEVVNVPANMNVQVTVHTRSTAGASFTLTNADTKDEILPEVLVKHNGTDDVTERPSHTILNAEKTIAGPLKVKVKVDSKAGRFSTQNFLLVVSFYKNK